MRFINKKGMCLCLVLFVAPSAASDRSVLSYGTAVITSFVREGIVMASDGLQISEVYTGDPTKPFREQRGEAESKVAVCNKVFLCGIAGINPLIIPKPANIEYHFQKWLPAAKAKTRPSVRNYTKIIQDKARITFKNMYIALKNDEFRKSKITSTNYFIKIAVAGYSGNGTPEYCETWIQFDRDKRRLVYPDIECATPVWTRPSSSLRYLLSGHQKVIDQSFVPGTSEFARFQQLLPDARATTGTLFPDTPPTLDEIVAEAAAMIAMQGEFYPEEIGGTTRIGMLIKGKLPTVHLPLTLPK
jgi:hypothetical protein